MNSSISVHVTCLEPGDLIVASVWNFNIIFDPRDVAAGRVSGGMFPLMFIRFMQAKESESEDAFGTITLLLAMNDGSVIDLPFSDNCQLQIERRM